MIAERLCKRFIYSQPTSPTHNCCICIRICIRICICLFSFFPSHFSPFTLRPDAACYAAVVVESFKMPRNKDSKERELIHHTQAFENTSTNVAAAQMRNALTNLAETVEDPKEKKVSLAKKDQKISAMVVANANRLFSCSKPKWTTSLPSSDDTSTTRPREMRCMLPLSFSPSNL